MTSKVTLARWAAGLLVMSLVGCGGAAIPQDQLSAAQAATKGAEVAGAPEDPKASLYLKLANEQIEKAKKLIANNDNEEAARVIDRAQADAELSLVLAKESRAKKEATALREQVEELKQRIQK